MCDLIESAENALESLGSVREAIIQIEATNANRTILDRSYLAILEAQRELSNLIGNSVVQAD